MTTTMFISILLAIIGFVGALMVRQLMSIAKSVNNIHADLKVLTNDHTNLKEEVKEIKKKVTILETV